jgi:hypothetical protein
VFCVKDVTKTQNIKKIISGIKGDIIIQKGINQSKIIQQLSNNSINTVRILSFLDKTGKVIIYSRIIRMGVGDKAVDNASSGGITCGIEKEGRLKPKAFDEKGNMYEKHPTTGAVFSDIVLPSLDTAETLIRYAHIKIPHFRLVSWDIAFNEKDEPVLIETNLKDGGLRIHQLNNGPLFGDDTEKILGEVFIRPRREL